MIDLLIFSGGAPTHETAGEMAERITDLVYEYSDRIPLAAAVGVLEIVKVEILAKASTQ